jgi:hypothetical protein
MVMVATIMGIGLKEECKGLENFMTLMAIYNMKGNGKMIIIMVKVHSMVLMM